MSIASTAPSPHSTNPKSSFRIHPSLVSFAVPISNICQLERNAGITIIVGLIIVGKTPIDVDLAPARPSTTDIHLPDDKHTPTALLVRPSSAKVLSENGQSDCSWNIPHTPVKPNLDKTLLEAVDRCARMYTTQGVKEISRCLGRSECTIGQLQDEEVKELAVRCDFLVKLNRGPIVLPEDVEGKWVGTDESWRVMKGLPGDSVLSG